jgi:hypothetical protein
MRAKHAFVSILTGLALAALLAAPASAAVNYNASKSNTGNVYFANLTGQERLALKALCTKHGGVVVTSGKGLVGCQVGSLADSKTISDGAAKGQANE